MSNKSVSQDAAAQNESFTELLAQLAKSSAVMVHDEIELVIQRVHEFVKTSRNGVVLIVTGSVIGFAAFLCLCAALIIELTSYMSLLHAALVTGVALAVVGIVIAFIGYRKLKK